MALGREALQAMMEQEAPHEEDEAPVNEDEAPVNEEEAPAVPPADELLQKTVEWEEKNPRVDQEMEIFYLIRQFLVEEEGCEGTIRTLEVEKSLYFDLAYFEQMLLAGSFDTGVQYLCGFTGIHTHDNSTWLVTEILKHKLLEALDRADLVFASAIVEKELNWVHPVIFHSLKSLLRPNFDFRQHHELSHYGYDVESMRTSLVTMIRDEKAITDHPHLRNKMVLPRVRTKQLRAIHADFVARSHELQQAANKELLYLIRQFLKDENCNNTVRMLEIEKSLLFDLSYFRDLASAGEWMYAVHYILPLPDVSGIIMKLMEQDYLEALSSGDASKGITILRCCKDKVDPEKLKNLSVLLAYSNFREHPDYEHIDNDFYSMRKAVVAQLEEDVSKHPLLKERLKLPWIRSDLRSIYNGHREVKVARRRASI
ncbi:protein TPR1 isoform X2 [Iris pallida]|uniref:Protein TPR1 isoform X2 n=1 Tax=Iris pallida TaxID=29817 RepID=A0AAX6ILU1_IRIPA|nr:protein TPR1 isoform X2 [Iris pallida]